MVLTLLPVSALAEGGAPAEAKPEYVAQIGEKQFATLQAAIDAVTTDTPTTIDVLADLTPDTLNAVTSVSPDRQMAFTKPNVNITLNLNNHTVTALGGEAIKINAANVTLTVTDGTIENHATGDYSDGLYAYKESNNLNLTLTNVKIHSRTQGLAVQGLTSNSNVTINGGEIISSEGLGIYYPPKSGTLTVNDAKIEGKTGIVVKGSNLIVKGNSEIIGVGDKIVPDHYYTGATDGSSSLTETGDAIYVESGYDDRDITVKIENGKLTSANSYAIQYYDYAKPVSAKREITISGGTFSDLSALDYLASGANVTVQLAADTTKDVIIPINGNVNLDLNGKTFTTVDCGLSVANGATLTVSDSGTGGKLTSSGTPIRVDGTGSKAIINNGTIESTNDYGIYAKNNGAIIVNGGTVTSKDAALSGNNTTGNMNFEVNGGTLTAAQGPAIYMPGQVNLTVTNGTLNGGISLRMGQVNISGGTINSISTGIDSPAKYYNYSGSAWLPDALYVFGGTYTSEDAQYGNSLNLNITGGTFNCLNDQGSAVAIYDIGKVAQTANVTISGGTFTANSTTRKAYQVLNLSDIGVTDPKAEYNNPDYVGKVNSSLTGGTYSADPSAYVAPGYVASYNGSTYTVYYPVPVIPNNNNNSSSTTTKNPDGSTTTTTTDKATGAVTETTTTANGSVGTVKTDANGSTEISASISAADVKAAEQKNAPVIAPITVTPAASSAAAPVIKLSVPANAGEVAVAIPVVNAKQGTVAVRVNPDGTEEIIKTAVITENGLVLGVKGSMQIKVINNSKNFADTVGHWAASDVDFVSARELFNGTAPALFSPEANMTRGMVVTVIARLAGENTDGGANWYDKGCAWAVANGVSDGTDPNGSITREQLAAMLYRYYGSPAASGSLSSYADAASVSAFASDAMQWCVNNGIINGMDGLLNPQGQATRAQVSAMFARYIRLAAAK